jgi:hypothetical protein
MPKSVRRPSPALIVAIVALVAALAGSAIALPGKNSVKKNDIAKNAVVSKAIKNDKVTGADVNESSLGTVPSAALANDSAAIGGVKIVRVAPFTLTDGQTRVVLTEGPFTFTAECTIDDGGTDTAEILIDTNADNTAYDGDDDDGDFDAADPANEFAADSAATNDPFFDEESDGAAIAPDGTEILGSRLHTGGNVLGQDDVCRFGGYFGIG